jgi:hypothetical protein
MNKIEKILELQEKSDKAQEAADAYKAEADNMRHEMEAEMRHNLKGRSF